MRVVFALVVCSSLAAAQTPVDSALLRYINGIKAIDSHAHPMRPVQPGQPADTDFDALPLDGIPPFPVPARLQGTDAIWHEAQVALFGAPPRPAASESLHKEGVKAAAIRMLKVEGDNFPPWALDKAGIDIMMANRIVMGPGLAAPRFRWVVYVDDLMLPLNTELLAAQTPDYKVLYPREEKLLKRHLRELGMDSVPATLRDYVSRVVIPTLERQHAAGAVAVKFEAAYLRSLEFLDPTERLAANMYETKTRALSPEVYKILQDYLFHVIVREAGRLNEAVQIHTLEDFGGYYHASTSTPFALEPIFNDSTLRKTNFIIVHGGWPFYQQTEAMLGKPNVYADISMMTLLLPPAQIAPVLRQWLTQWPDKVLFGTDAFDGGPEQGWEQAAWVGSTTARRALAMALTAMLRDGEVTRARAQELARMVLRENAIRAYQLDLK